jgi:Uma2 family endonuclease
MNLFTETTLEEDLYPSSDGKPMAETQVHVRLMGRLLGILEHHFRDHDDVFVAANIFLYYAKGQPKKRRSPDVMVVKGVNKRPDRRSFKTWVERAVPSCIIELTSRKTAKEDLRQKKPLYQKLGVREYFLFDPLGEYLPRPLMGFRLVKGQYQPIKARPDGSIRSRELGLLLRPEGTNLALYDLKTGERLPSLDELHERNEELKAELARLKAAKNGAAS